MGLKQMLEAKARREQDAMYGGGQIPGMGPGYSINPGWNGQIPGGGSISYPRRVVPPSSASSIDMINQAMNGTPTNPPIMPLPNRQRGMK